MIPSAFTASDAPEHTQRAPRPFGTEFLYSALFIRKKDTLSYGRGVCPPLERELATALRTFSKVLTHLLMCLVLNIIVFFLSVNEKKQIVILSKAKNLVNSYTSFRTCFKISAVLKKS